MYHMNDKKKSTITCPVIGYKNHYDTVGWGNNEDGG